MSSPYTLVVQSDALNPAHIIDIAQLAEAPHLDQPLPTVARLRGASIALRTSVLARCDEYGYDAAYIETGRHLSDFRLLVSDMDSTLITIECIDEIADLHGLKPQVAAITERSMRGELDFTASLQQRIALLQGLPESALEQVYRERVRLSPGAESLLASCKRLGIKFMLVSGGFTFFTERLKADYGLDYAYANQLEIIDGKLSGRLLGDIVDAAAKQKLLIAHREMLRLRPEQVIAMGDGANDLLMLTAAGVGVAYHAKPVVRAQADIAINHGGLDRLLNYFH
ncbi:phosphoserine phosphatase SerB [Neisseriaceae bacterium TC5R-5]|nr:phosphoserine phosphatase SerB [Neisseriaceae bacterium TC5R-5]